MYKRADMKYITFHPAPYATSSRDRLMTTIMYLAYVQMGMDELGELRELPLVKQKYNAKVVETSSEMQRTYTQSKSAMRNGMNLRNWQNMLDVIADISDSLQPKVNVVRNIIRERLVTRLPYNLIEAATRSAMTWLFFELANQSLTLMGNTRRENITRAEIAVQEIYDDIKQSKYASMEDIVTEPELDPMINAVAKLCREGIEPQNANKPENEAIIPNAVNYTKTNRTHEIDTFLRQIATQNGLTCQNGMRTN